MARSGKYLYYTYNGSNCCVPLYNNTECFSCVTYNRSYLCINTAGTTHYALTASNKNCSDTTYLRFNNNYVYNGICYKVYQDCGHHYNYISGIAGLTTSPLTFSACTIAFRCTSFDRTSESYILSMDICINGYFHPADGLLTKKFSNGKTDSVAVFGGSYYNCIISSLGTTSIAQFSADGTSSGFYCLKGNESISYY